MCRFHYSLTNVTSRVTNESITVFTTTNFITESDTVATNWFTARTKYSTVTEIDIVIQLVMEFVGMGNWEQVHTFAAVCKFLRHSSLPHLYNIGKVPMDGGAECRLNVGAFLHFLQSKYFRNVQCIFKLIWSWGRRSMAVAGEVTRHGQAHPYSWLITIVSLRSKKSEE
jgi:hypothetical protein